MLTAAGSENKQQVPCFFPSPGGGGRGQALPSRWYDRVCPGVGRGRGLGGCPLICGDELGQAQYPAFVPNFQLLFLVLQKWQLGFGGEGCLFRSRISPSCTCTQFPVPYRCFVFYNWKRGVSRCQLHSRGPQVPGLQDWPPFLKC